MWAGKKSFFFSFLAMGTCFFLLVMWLYKLTKQGEYTIASQIKKQLGMDNIQCFHMFYNLNCPWLQLYKSTMSSHLWDTILV